MFEKQKIDQKRIEYFKQIIENLDKISQFFQTVNKNNQNNAAALKAVNSDRSHENI